MKSVMKHLNSAFKCLLALGMLCYAVYPTALTLARQALFLKQANGNLTVVTADDQEQVVGSEYAGQRLEDSRSLHGRISSVNYNCHAEGEKAGGSYGGVSSGPYNYGNLNLDLEARVKIDLVAWMKDHPGVRWEGIPSELLITSGSGLNPHTAVQGARVQVGAITEVSSLTEDKLNSIMDRNITSRILDIFGEEIVNILGCNLDIAGALGIISRGQG